MVGTFPQPTACLLNCVFKEQFVIFIKSSWWCAVFNEPSFWNSIRASVWLQITKSFFCFVFVFYKFLVLGFTFMPMIHFELMFGQSTILPHASRICGSFSTLPTLSSAGRVPFLLPHHTNHLHYCILEVQLKSSSTNGPTSSSAKLFWLLPFPPQLSNYSIFTEILIGKLLSQDYIMNNQQMRNNEPFNPWT